MSSRKNYLVESDCMALEFTRETEAAAVRQLKVCAEATPEVQCDLYEWDAANDAWAWVSSVVDSQELDEVVRVLD